MKHDLPSGGWADLCEPEEVTERARRPVARLQAKLAMLPGVLDAVSQAGKLGVTDGESLSGLDDESSFALAATMGDALPLMEELNDLLIIARLREWSYDLPLELDSLLDLPSPDYAALQELCSSTAGIVAEVEPNPDPKASTPNSGV